MHDRGKDSRNLKKLALHTRDSTTQHGNAQITPPEPHTPFDLP
jgi:hypothetical protein